MLCSLSMQNMISGVLTILSLYVLAYVFHTLGLTLGRQKVPRRCTEWQGTCSVCLSSRTWLEEVFCANFYQSVNDFSPCQSMWCGRCYTTPPKPHFPIMSIDHQGLHPEKGRHLRLTEAWKKLHKKPDAFLHARDGDHTLAPFECDVCIYRKLKGKEPPRDQRSMSATDELLLACIRRANLDSFWSLASSTVDGNTRKLKLGIKFSNQLGLYGPYLQEGSLPPNDYCGYEVAIQMLMNSIRPGVNNPKYTQFDTIRKLRTGYSNFIRASNSANQASLTINDQGGNYQRISQDACGTLWFKKFLKGCHNRMGQEWVPNKALNIPLLKRLLKEVELLIAATSDKEECHDWVVFSAYVVVTYVISLRGNETFFLDLEGLHRHWTKPEKGYIILALMGRIKGEKHDLAHLIPCSNHTSSGIPVRQVIERLLRQKKRLGIVDGPAITDSKKMLFSCKDIDDKLLEILVKIYEEDPDLFPVEIQGDIKRAKGNSETVIKKFYSCFRIFRRTSNSRAFEINDKLKQDDIDIVNRWRSEEKGNGKRPLYSMKQHYAEVSVLLKPFLRYTHAM